MFTIAGKTFASRLLLGTAQYPSLKILKQAILSAKPAMMTVALRRQLNSPLPNAFWALLNTLPCDLLPNTAGCMTAKEAIATAQMARELFNTPWIKLEVIGDDYTLQPHPFELVIAAKELVTQGFIVLPYCTEDLIVCDALVNASCAALMPWAAPIGSGQGIQRIQELTLLRQRFSHLPIIIDAGIGKPSHAALAMELGFDAVLLNTAVAKAHDPITMAQAFARAVESGRLGFEAGLITPSHRARASTPLIDKPFWQVTHE